MQEPALQPSARVMSHDSHAAPPVPHAASPGIAVHVVPLSVQHPVGHEVASHTHRPPAQR